jgi:putative ATPase
MDMFERYSDKLMEKEAPLAARMRPSNLHDFVGQEHLIGEGR